MKKKFLDFLETVPDAMILSDRGGRIVLVNRSAEQMFGYSRDELLGKEVEILVPERLRARHRIERAAYYAESRVRPMAVGRDVSACGKDGVEFPVEISLSPLEYKGNVLVWSAIRSISCRERSIAEVRQAVQHRMNALRGLICICAWCKRVHDESGSWQQLEKYIEAHSKTKFSHGVCPDCLRKLDPRHV
jgi:PAS domain S-box-containing protein